MYVLGTMVVVVGAAAVGSWLLHAEFAQCLFGSAVGVGLYWLWKYWETKDGDHV